MKKYMTSFLAFLFVAAGISGSSFAASAEDHEAVTPRLSTSCPAASTVTWTSSYSAPATWSAFNTNGSGPWTGTFGGCSVYSGPEVICYYNVPNESQIGASKTFSGYSSCTCDSNTGSITCS